VAAVEAAAGVGYDARPRERPAGSQAPIVQWLGRRPFKAVTRVRIPLGVLDLAVGEPPDLLGAERNAGK
jgi:hypothetical protein